MNSDQIALISDLEAAVTAYNDIKTTYAAVSASCTAKGAPLEKAYVDAVATALDAAQSAVDALDAARARLAEFGAIT